MPSKKRKYNARFPAGRIKKIMQTDEEVGKVAQAVPVIISRTLELFVESLITKAMEITNAKNAKTLSPSHMKQCILSESRFDFLKDLVKNIPDINNEECADNIPVNAASPSLTSQPPPLAPISDYSKITQKPHCSNSTKESTTISSEQRNDIITDVQRESPINTSYSANFYAEQTSSAKLSSTVVDYQPIDQQNDYRDSAYSNVSSNGPSTFHIVSKMSDDNNDKIPPLIPIPQFTESKLYNSYSPNDNTLSIDEDYDN